MCVIQAAFPGRAGLHLLHPERDGPEDRRLHRRRAGGHDHGRRRRRRGPVLRTAHAVRRQLVAAPSCRAGSRRSTTPRPRYLSLACGVDMLTGVGMVSGGRIFSYEEMALAADTLTQARDDRAGHRPLDRWAGPPAGRLRRRRPAAHRRPAAPLLGGRRAAHGDRPRARARRADRRRARPPALDPAVDAELRRLARYRLSLRARPPTLAAQLVFWPACCITRNQKSQGGSATSCVSARGGGRARSDPDHEGPRGTPRRSQRKGRRHEEGQDLHPGSRTRSSRSSRWWHSLSAAGAAAAARAAVPARFSGRDRHADGDRDEDPRPRADRARRRRSSTAAASSSPTTPTTRRRARSTRRQASSSASTSTSPTAMGKMLGLDGRVQEPGVGDHPGRPPAGQVRRLHRLDDHHARAPEGPRLHRPVLLHLGPGLREEGRHADHRRQGPLRQDRRRRRRHHVLRLPQEVPEDRA